MPDSIRFPIIFVSPVLLEKIALKSIKHENIKDKAIDSAKIADKSIRKENIKDRAIDSLKIAQKSIKHENIKDKAIDSAKIADKSIRKENIKDGAITTEKIENGTILFEDIAANGATTAGVIMKWDGDSWELDDDATGEAAGWEDDGTVVRLETDTDSVGIGTIAPTEKLAVAGNIHTSGTISSGNSMTIDGTIDKITASSGTISFDNENLYTEGTISSGPSGSWI